jgi:D-lyxose ketol-isomerase
MSGAMRVEEKAGSITGEQVQAARKRAARMLSEAGIVLTPKELAKIEVVDFGLGDLERVGLEIVTYINNERYCAKELVLFPGQTCPEHRHPDGPDWRGKMETFRVRWGTVYLYGPGEPAPRLRAVVPAGAEEWYTVRHERVLRPGDQFTLPPDTRHWFQAGGEGAIVSEFSSTSRDDRDIFTDPRIRRV